MADNFKACCVEGCNKNSANGAGGRRGYCISHYWRWKKERSDLPKCSVADCERVCYALDLCAKHWNRLRRHGNPTSGRTEDGQPLKFLLAALSFTGDACLTWPYARDNHGYARVYDGARMKAAHILTCEAAHGPRPSKQHHAAHSCGKGHEGCINPKHVRWATASENQIDRVAHGTSNRGGRGTAKLTEDDVREIRRLAVSSTQTAIAKLFQVDPSHISNIIHRKVWEWLAD